MEEKEIFTNPIDKDGNNILLLYKKADKISKRKIHCYSTARDFVRLCDYAKNEGADYVCYICMYNGVITPPFKLLAILNVEDRYCTAISEFSFARYLYTYMDNTEPRIFSIDDLIDIETKATNIDSVKDSVRSYLYTVIFEEYDRERRDKRD